MGSCKQFLPSKNIFDTSKLENAPMSAKVYMLSSIFKTDPENLSNNDLSQLSFNVYHVLKGNDTLSFLANQEKLILNLETQNFTTIENTHKLVACDPWFCRLLLMASINHCDLVFTDFDEPKLNLIKCNYISLALRVIRPERHESIHLVKLIDRLTRYINFKSNPTAVRNTLEFAQMAAMCPFDGFKQHAENIAKKALWHIIKEQHTELLDLDCLPLRGISTLDFMRHFLKLVENRSQLQQVITRVIEMFSNNIENRDGSFLYKIVLERIDEDFEEWQHTVWPQFLKKFRELNCQGEFFQSLLKYWIPQTVAAFRSSLYRFVTTSTIPDSLKGYILLETRKKNFLYLPEQEHFCFIQLLFSQESTRNLAFKIVACSFDNDNKNRLPTIANMHFLQTYLEGQSNSLNSKEKQALQKFFTHIGLVIANVKVEKEYLKMQEEYLIKIFFYGVSLLKTGRRNLGAQILVALCNGILRDNLPLNRIDVYRNPENIFFRLVKHLKSDTFVRLVEQALLDCKGCNQEMSELAARVVRVSPVFNNSFLMAFIEKASDALSIKATESVKNLTQFVASVNTKDDDHDDNNYKLHDDIFKLLKTLFENHWTAEDMDVKVIFKTALLFEAFNQVSNFKSNDEPLVLLHSVWFPAVAKMLQQKYYQPKQEYLMATEQWLSAKNKTEKVVEAVYSNLCRYIQNNETTWACVQVPEFMQALVQVIDHSSMRKPTMLSVDLLKHAASLLEEEVQTSANYDNVETFSTSPNQSEVSQPEEGKTGTQMSFRKQLIMETLQKLEEVAPVQNLTIRRNPETRLVLHVLCASDDSPKKHLLFYTLTHLLKLLSDETRTDASISAVLHCTEILMSDHTLHEHTLRYASGVITECVRHFANRNWIVRNACIQLAKALIERFLGVLIGRNNRRKSVDNLFHLLPAIIPLFCRVLSQKPLSDSSLVVMQFFFESQNKSQPYPTQIGELSSELFLQLFMTLIKENSNIYGLFAAKAYVSLCLPLHISLVIRQTVEFIRDNFRAIESRHAVRNFVLLLQELYDKYLDYIKEKPSKPTDFYMIHLNLNHLTEFLMQFDTKRFDFILLKVIPRHCVIKILQETTFDPHNDYQQRLWLHNYLPFLVINSSTDNLPNVLTAIFAKKVPDCLQVKLLSILVDKFANFGGDDTQGILEVLVDKALDLEDSKNYLSMCYFKVILLMVEGRGRFGSLDPLLLDKLRQYQDNITSTIKNPYKLFVCLLLVSQIKQKINQDTNFVRSTITYVQSIISTNIVNDEDFIKSTSEMLKYFFQCAPCICFKRKVLKLALLLLLDHGLFHFATYINKKCHIPTPVLAMQKLLDYRFLTGIFKSDLLAFEFAKEFYTVAGRKVGGKKDNVTYYVEEECVFVDQACIGQVIVKFMYDFCTFREMDDWLAYYRKVRWANKLRFDD